MNTEEQMRALLTGRFSPSDMRDNERLPDYLTRKFNELKAQSNALSVECATLKEFALGLYSPDGTSRVEGEDLPKTPATDAYLNSVRAEGVEMAADCLKLKNTVGSTGAMAYLLNTMAFELRAGEPS